MARPTQIPTWTLGDRLAKARHCVGLTAAEMARILRVSPRTVVGWENDQHRPPFTAVAAWADVCNVPLAWLETGADQELSVSTCNPTVMAA